MDGKGTKVTNKVRAYEVAGQPNQKVLVEFKKNYNKGWNRVVSKTIIGDPVGPPEQPGIDYLWDEGFESGTSGWYDADRDWYGDISVDGSGHAIVNGDSSSAPMSRFGGYRDVWQGGWTAEVDVYLDPSWEDGAGFDYSVAANGTDNAHQRDYIFHVTKDSSTGDLLVAGSTNTDFVPREDLEDRNHYVVTEAGWYTLQHEFYEENGALQVDLNLLDENGTVLFTETLVPHAGDDLMDEIGGNRYGWFTTVTVPDLAIDNHQLYLTDDA